MADWSKAHRLGPLEMIRECTTIALLESVVHKKVDQAGIEWIADRLDQLMSALIDGKGLVKNEDNTYAIVDRPEGFKPDEGPSDVLIIKPKSQTGEKR